MNLNTSLTQLNKSKLKQEFLSIAFLSISQIILSYYFPSYMGLGKHFRIIALVISSIVSVCVYVITFSCANQYAYYLNFDGYDLMPHAHLLKKITQASILALWISIFYFLWHINFYNMSNLHYLLLYIHISFGFFLFCKAAYRSPIS